MAPPQNQFAYIVYNDKIESRYKVVDFRGTPVFVGKAGPCLSYATKEADGHGAILIFDECELNSGAEIAEKSFIFGTHPSFTKFRAPELNIKGQGDITFSDLNIQIPKVSISECKLTLRNCSLSGHWIISDTQIRIEGCEIQAMNLERCSQSFLDKNVITWEFFMSFPKESILSRNIFNGGLRIEAGRDNIISDNIIKEKMSIYGNNMNNIIRNNTKK